MVHDVGLIGLGATILFYLIMLLLRETDFGKQEKHITQTS